MKELLKYQKWVSDNITDIGYYTPKQIVRMYLKATI